MSILGYEFIRAEDYEDRVKRLSHHISSVGEFEISYSTGEHMITATVESPPNEHQSPLAHGQPVTILEDLLLILSLFTGREVFSTENNYIKCDVPVAIARDFRPYLGYQSLGVSIPARMFEGDGEPPCDVGFEEGLERVLKHIHNKEWLEKFEQGIILFIARQIFTFQVLEKAFLMAYVLWEHVFYMEKRTTLSEKQIKDTDGAQKVRFLLERYGFTPKLNGEQKTSIYESLTQTRNNLVHYGMFRQKEHEQHDAIQFVELTTRLLAKILGLEPADAKNTQEWLETMIRCKPESVRSAP